MTRSINRIHGSSTNGPSSSDDGEGVILSVAKDPLSFGRCPGNGGILRCAQDDTLPPLCSSSHFSHRFWSGERGFVLVSALVLAVLFLGLIELTLLDSSTRMESAQRFRSRIAARILAENGAELAAQNMVNAASTTGEAEIEGGACEGNFERSADSFVLRGRGHTSGVRTSSAGIELVGRIEDRTIWIDSSRQLP